MRAAMPSPARSCTRCAAARWRRWARYPSASTTAASTPRRCSSCSPASTRSAPATTRSIRELWPAIERALAWIDEEGDLDGDGFIEYARAAETGLANQGWKDSHDAVFHADGSLAEGPIALVEVQGYVYAAKRLAAACARKLGHARARRRAAAAGGRSAGPIRRGLLVRGDRHLRAGARRRQAALQGAHQQCRPCAGHAASPAAIALAASPTRSCIPRFYSGWGIRTVAYGEARYNPMSYHNGSIWPHDNALIAQGLARYGRKSGINLIFDGLVRATTYMEHRRIPELYCGFRRRPGRGPTLYPAACSPQAWAAGAPFLMLQAMLGLEFDHEGAQDPPDQSLSACLSGPDHRSQSHARRRQVSTSPFARTARRVSAGIAHHRRSADFPAVRCERQALAHDRRTAAASRYRAGGQPASASRLRASRGAGRRRTERSCLARSCAEAGPLLLDASLRVLRSAFRRTGWGLGWTDMDSLLPPRITTPAAAMCSLAGARPARSERTKQPFVLRPVKAADEVQRAGSL